MPAPPPPDLPKKHLKTHAGRRLGKTAADSTLDRWTKHASECAQLRCRYLRDKAHEATHHAERLHDRLTHLLVDQQATLEPGQGATLVGALNVLARQAMAGSSRTTTASNWWRRHRDYIHSLAPCDPQKDACPDCHEGHPCPIDIAHQPIATAILYHYADTLSNARRKKVSSQNKWSFITVWSGWGCHDLAGYAAWLAADSWMAEGNHRRAASVIDHAMDAGAHDPEVLRVYAQRLVLQGRDEEAIELASEHLERATTDPGWHKLRSWLTRHVARQNAADGRPTASRTNPQLIRPVNRARAPRFTV